MKFQNDKTLNDWTGRLPCRDFAQFLLDLFPLLERESLSADCSPLHNPEDICFSPEAQIQIGGTRRSSLMTAA